MNRRGINKWIVGIGGFLILVFVTVLLVLPRVIDSQTLKEQIRIFLSERTSGSVAIKTIDLVWIPRPQVVIRNVSISVADRAQGRFETLRVYPSILGLLIGRLVVQRVSLERPAITIRVPEWSEEPLELEYVETILRAWLAALTSKVPVVVVGIEHGSAEISIGNRSPVLVKDIDARFAASPGHFTASLTASSNLCAKFRIQGRIASFDLASAADVKIERLRLREALDSFLPRGSEYIEDGEISLDLELSSLGLRRINADFNGSLPALTVVHEGERTRIKAKRFNGVVALDEAIGRVAVKRLELISPRLTASGELMIERSSSLAHIKLLAQDLDVKGIRDDALRIAGEISIVRQIFNHVRGGTIPKITFESKGRSLPDLAKAQNVIVTGEMRSGRVFIPGPDLHLEDVDGSMAIAGGILEGKNVSLRSGGTKGWDGKVRLGLEGESAPFHLDVMIESNAAELQSMSLRFVKHEPFRSEVSRIHNVKGELMGRIVLGERLDAISPVVSILKMDVTATYDPIPFPIAIKGGRFTYGQNTISLENLQGTVGRSSWAALSGTLNHDASRRMKIDSGRMALDLEQIKILLQSIKEAPSELLKLQSVRGQIELEKLALTGAYDDPAGWKFSSSGTVKQVAISHAQFPGPISMARGKFTATEERIAFSDTAVEMLDATLLGGGIFQNRKGDRVKVEANGEGVVGEQMTRWLGRQIELPEELLLRFPWKIAATRLAWQAPDDISFRGKASMAGGPEIIFDAERQPRRVAVRDLTIEDGGRRAQMTLQLAKDNLALSFKGELGRQTLDKIFPSLPAQAVSLQGDIRVNASLQQPVRFSAHGRLEGGNVLLPLGQERAVIEKFRIEAGGENIQIRAADLRWRNSRLTVSGKVVAAQEAVRVDLDVSGDRLDWGELNRSFGRAGAQKKDNADAAVSLPPVQGTIRLKVDSFAFERFNLSPLRLTANSSPSGIRAEIEQALACGINATGQLDIAGEEIKFDVAFAAKEAQLEPTTVCLLDRHHNVKGTYALKGRIAGRGKREELKSSLKGNFEFSARDGEFVRSPGMDATFDYLNATGDFKVAFPDLDKETFPYRLVSVKGRIDGEIIVGDEIIVQSSLLNLSGQGKIDLARKRIDGKGLIAVLKPVDEVISRIPVVGSIFGGSLLAIPVRVAGPLDQPVVNYLSPADIGTELLNMPMRILGLPMEALRLFTPSGENRDKNSIQ